MDSLSISMLRFVTRLTIKSDTGIFSIPAKFRSYGVIDGKSDRIVVTLRYAVIRYYFFLI